MGEILEQYVEAIGLTQEVEHKQYMSSELNTYNTIWTYRKGKLFVSLLTIYEMFDYYQGAMIKRR